jgi:hypothetical protein
MVERKCIQILCDDYLTKNEICRHCKYNQILADPDYINPYDELNIPDRLIESIPDEIQSRIYKLIEEFK